MGAPSRSLVVVIAATLAIALLVPPALADTQRQRLVIHGAGDVDVSPTLSYRFRYEGYEVAWAGLGGLFLRDHLTIINLECAPSILGYPIPKETNLRCDQDALPAMRTAGVDVVSQANNHAGDYGPTALVDGIANLRAAGLVTVGSGASLAEAMAPGIVDVGGWRIAIVGLTTVSGYAVGEPGGAWFASSDRPGVAYASMENIATAVGAAREAADIVIVTVHWGNEGMGYPDHGDRLRAGAMIAAGADVILGHHSHRLQPLEVVDGVPVFWSLGNFVWPNTSATGSTTGIAEIIVEPDGTIHARIIPAYIESHGQPVLRGHPDWTLRADRKLIR
ncbi:MAG TPA: CapA family protein [Acidimicrobiia bacterium]|nr:CapA family protein [Acidimicrobiia bacterium]